MFKVQRQSSKYKKSSLRYICKEYSQLPSANSAHGGTATGEGDFCWFVQARGSGVFAHTGRSLRVTSRALLPPALGLNASSVPRRDRRIP